MPEEMSQARIKSEGKDKERPWFSVYNVGDGTLLYDDDLINDCVLFCVRNGYDIVEMPRA